MDVLVETLRLVRGVRDWAHQRRRRTAASARTRIVLDQAVTTAEAALRLEAPQIEPLGPARAPVEPEPSASAQPRVRLEDIDPHAVSAIRRLRRHGHKAYIVGGCVRDLLLDAEPKDFDVATDARPEEVKALFRNSRIIGRRFRLVHLFFRGGHIIEVATFRAQVQNGDADGDDDDLLIRRDNVFGSEEEDARRRDFTINGLFYDVTRGRIIDHVGGLEDLEHRYLRMIGDPDTRLREDPVRILRAIRFTAKNDLRVDQELAAGIQAHREELVRCAPARLLEEFLKLLRAGFSAKTVPLMHEWGVLEVLMPEIAAFLDGTLFPGGEFAADAEENRRRMQAHLEALDHLVSRGQVDDAVVVGALLMAPVATLLEAAEAEGVDRNRVVNELLATVGQRISLTRRLHENLRQMFSAQRHLGVAGGGRRRRRPSPQSFVRRSFFPQALQLYEIRTRALELPLTEVAAWHERALQERIDVGPRLPRSEGGAQAESTETEDQTSPRSSNGRRKRRRRKGNAGSRSGPSDSARAN